MMLDVAQETAAGKKEGGLRKRPGANRFFATNVMIEALLSLALLCASGLAVPAQVCDSGPTTARCPALLLDGECRAYKASLASAATSQARETVKAHYQLLLKERERTCPCDAYHEWIRISKSPARLIVSLQGN